MAWKIGNMAPPRPLFANAPPCQCPAHPECRIMASPVNAPPFENEESWLPEGFFFEEFHVFGLFWSSKVLLVGHTRFWSLMGSISWMELLVVFV